MIPIDTVIIFGTKLQISNMLISLYCNSLVLLLYLTTGNTYNAWSRISFTVLVMDWYLIWYRLCYFIIYTLSLFYTNRHSIFFHYDLLHKKKSGKKINSRARMFGSSNNTNQSLNYYCMACGTKHNDAACPRCGSKMKRVGSWYDWLYLWIQFVLAILCRHNC